MPPPPQLRSAALVQTEQAGGVCARTWLEPRTRSPAWGHCPVRAGPLGSGHWDGGRHLPQLPAVMGRGCWAACPQFTQDSWGSELPRHTPGEARPLSPQEPPCSVSGACLEPPNSGARWKEYCWSQFYNLVVFWPLASDRTGRGEQAAAISLAEDFTEKSFSRLVPVRHRISLKTRQSLEEGSTHGS